MDWNQQRDREWQCAQEREWQQSLYSSGKIKPMRNKEAELLTVLAGLYLPKYTDRVNCAQWAVDNQKDLSFTTAEIGTSEKHRLAKELCREYAAASGVEFTRRKGEHISQVVNYIIVNRLKYKSVVQCECKNPKVYRVIVDAVNSYGWYTAENKSRTIDRHETIDVALVANTIFKKLQDTHDTDNWYVRKPATTRVRPSPRPATETKALETPQDEFTAILDYLKTNTYTAYTDTEVSRALGISRRTAGLRLNHLVKEDNAVVFLVSEHPKRYMHIPERRDRKNRAIHGLLPVCAAIRKLLTKNSSLNKRQIRSQIREILGGLRDMTIDLALDALIESGLVRCYAVNGREHAYKSTEVMNKARLLALLKTDRYAKFAPNQD